MRLKKARADARADDLSVRPMWRRARDRGDAPVSRARAREAMSVFPVASTSAPAAAAAAAAAATPSVGAVRQQGDGWSPASRFRKSPVSAAKIGAWKRDRARSGASARGAASARDATARVGVFRGEKGGGCDEGDVGKSDLSNGLGGRLGELDVEHASTIAVAMDVNEIASVELIVGAIENGAPADAAVPAAIGILMRERASAPSRCSRFCGARAGRFPWIASWMMNSRSTSRTF